MKKILLLLLLGTAFTLLANRSYGGGIIFYSTGQTFKTTEHLPDSVTMEDGTHINLGVAFKQFAIMWIPVWNYGTTEYALVPDKGDEAYRADEESLAYIKEEFGIDTDKAPQIPFWDRIGGKLIWAAVIGFCVWGGVSKNKKDDDEEEIETDTPQVEKREL